MNTKDRTMFITLLVALAGALFMGASNVYANLMSSGNLVFLDDPWLAVSLSILVPAGSFALKMATNFMEFDRSRKLYARTITIITAVLLFSWVILFAKNFTGVAGGIDWSSLGDSDEGGPLFVFTQTAAEMFVSATLFLALENLWEKYHPTKIVDNPAYIEADRTYKEHLPAHQEVSDERAHLHGRLVELEAAREKFITEHVAAYLSLRNRHSALNNY